ncbi:MAG: hypothetical protein MJ252_19640 [archaeon]|nr:hypothetical protein [archaeon]
MEALQREENQFGVDSSGSKFSVSDFADYFSPIKNSNLKLNPKETQMNEAQVKPFELQKTSFFKSEPKKVSFDETNAMKIKFPEDMPKEDILAILMSYGDMEKISYLPEGEVEVSYVHILAAKKAYDELKLSLIKFDSEINLENYLTYTQINFSENFFLSLNYSSNMMYPCYMFQNIQNFIFFLMNRTKLYKIYYKQETQSKANLVIQFENIHDKTFVDFMLKRWKGLSTTNQTSKFDLPNETEEDYSSSEKVAFPDLSSYNVLYTYNKQMDAMFQAQKEKQEAFLNLQRQLYFQTVNQMNSQFPIQNQSQIPLTKTPLKLPDAPFEFKFRRNEESKSNSSGSSKKEDSPKDKIEIESLDYSDDKSPIKKDMKLVIKSYEKTFSGIKQRSIPTEDREKYAIKPERIINEVDQRTTIMIKNIPRKISQKYLIMLFNETYEDEFNFFYLPIDFSKGINVGYAFMNFRNCRKIIQFYLEYNEKPWPFNKKTKCYISYARIQGFKSIAQHFEKSNIMNQSKEEFKPFITEV